MKKNFLGLTPAQFLRSHWQKKPLLVRGALPEFSTFTDRRALEALAAREDVVSRLVLHTRGGWEVRHGPFARRTYARLPARGWSLLVQGVNHTVPQAAHLLQAFGFLPYARLDDVMVSYAPPGGGVGPHFDSYDVFLLQGPGRRRWAVSAQRDLELVPEAPLKVLKRFRAEQEWTLETGDLLYLPPHYAHDGVALNECITISVGFRAPSAAEITNRFLEFLQDTRAPEGLYSDPDLKPTTHPAAIGSDMLAQFARVLARIRWTGRDIVQFAGAYLTEPKSHIVFVRPDPPLPRDGFSRAIAHRGVRLALPTLMLYRGRCVFVNGEAAQVTRGAAPLFAQLANRRELPPPLACEASALQLLHEWYRSGYVEVGPGPSRQAQP